MNGSDKVKKERSGGTYRDYAARLEKEKRKNPVAQKKKPSPVRKVKTYFDHNTSAEPKLIHTCPITGEQMYEFVHPCGAKLIYIHKDVSLSAGAVSIPYGGDDTHISIERGRRVMSLSGCAHFAEHMLFTGKGGRLERFLSMGADANAFTSPTSTVYCFTSGTEKGTINAFSELMKMVLKPEFDEGQTEKEREIILRELEEDDDVFFEGRRRLTRMLWSRGSIRRDPGGSAKYVRRITNEMLRAVYEGAYRTSDLVFALVSNIGVANARGIFELNLLGLPYPGKVIHSYCRNIPGEKKRRDEFSHESGSTVFFCGLSPNLSVSDTAIDDGKRYARHYVYTALLESMLFDRTEPLYLRLSESVSGIYGEFVSDAELRHGECILSANLMCEDPEEVADGFVRIFEELRQSGELFEFENFESKRRTLAADYLSLLESPSEMSLSLCEYAHEGESFFGAAEIIMGIDKETFVGWAKEAVGNAEPVIALACKCKAKL